MKAGKGSAGDEATSSRSNAAGPPRWTRWAIGFALLIFAVEIVSGFRNVDLDLFHEMALFREALALGSLPRTDLYAYTPTVNPVVHHEWGTGAVLYLVAVASGLGATGLILLRFLLVAGTAACCIAVARRRGAGGLELAMFAPLAILLFSTGLSPVRAHMFTFLFLAVLLYLLEREREGARRWLLLWPPLFVAWLNLHGGFVVGAGMLGIYTAERLVRLARSGGPRVAVSGTRHLLAATAATPPLLLLNPYGADYVPYLWRALLLDRPEIPEWAPLWAPQFREGPLMLFLLSMLFVAYSLARGRAWKGSPGLPLVIVAAVFALSSVRILPIYTVVWASYVPAALAGTSLAGIVSTFWSRHARTLAAAALVVGALGVGRLVRADPFTLVVPAEAGQRLVYPAGAVDYLEQAGFQGNLMTPFGYGAYVSWRLFPDVKVGLDSRYEVAYPPEFVEEAMRIYRGDGDWREFLDRHPTDAVLVPSDGPLDSLMAGAAGDAAASWTEAYRDDAYAVFARPELRDRLPVTDRRGEPIRGRFP